MIGEDKINRKREKTASNSCHFAFLSISCHTIGQASFADM